MERTILHINVINFYVAVARSMNSELVGYPVAVRACGSKKVLLDVSKEASESGVHRGMNVNAAMRICRDLRVTDPLPSVYDRVERFLFQYASRLSPQTETAGPGHLFIDLTGTRRLLGPAVDVADSARRFIKEECRFDSAIGLAASRLVSKIATRVIKPQGLCTVIQGCEEEFMAPLPVNYLPGIDHHFLKQLLQFNFQLIRDINRIPVQTLATVLGPVAWEICNQARGIDDTPVRQISEPAPSVYETVTLGEPTNNESEIAGALFHIVSRCGAKIRKMGLAAGKVYLNITYADGIRNFRSVRLNPPLSGDLSIYKQCALLLRKLFLRRVRLTDLTVRFSELTFPYGQMDLFMDNQREENLMNAIDTIHQNFGERAIRFWGRNYVA